jgi:hypothetical protein
MALAHRSVGVGPPIRGKRERYEGRPVDGNDGTGGPDGVLREGHVCYTLNVTALALRIVVLPLK